MKKERFIGFRWEFPGKVNSLTLDDMVLEIKNKVGKIDRFTKWEDVEKTVGYGHRGLHRLILFDMLESEPDYLLGLVLSAKNLGDIYAVVFDDGSAKVQKQDVARGRKPVDFNMFVLHRKSLRGLYQYHHIT